MTKIMLVEDDKSLREIYGVRLLAEGYDIVSAENGEEALAMAIKERPNLVVSDVMMPKISGFDMLDILRSTTETRDIKVIMMTALSSDEQRARGEQLGANRYLVKSQVGIEDVVRVVHEVLGDTPATAPAAAPSPVALPAAPPAAAPTPAPQPAPAAPAPVQPPAAAPAPVAPAPVAPPAPASDVTEPASNHSRTIAPLNDPFTSKVNINDLLDKELAKEAGVAENQRPAVMDTQSEKSAVNEQINQFSQLPPAPVPDNQSAPAAPPVAPAPAPVTPPAPAPVQPPAPAPAAAPAQPAPTPAGPPLPPGHTPPPPPLDQ